MLSSLDCLDSLVPELFLASRCSDFFGSLSIEFFLATWRLDSFWILGGRASSALWRPNCALLVTVEGIKGLGR